MGFCGAIQPLRHAHAVVSPGHTLPIMSSRFALPLRSTLAAAAVFGLLLGRGVDARRLKQDSSEPPCPEVSLDNLSELAGPCSNADQACDMEGGCIGAVISYVGTRVDLTSFEEAPPAEYVADCVAPFALSEEVTSTIPQETLGAMIACDFDAVTARFERDFAPAPATATATAPAPAPA